MDARYKIPLLQRIAGLLALFAFLFAGMTGADAAQRLQGKFSVNAPQNARPLQLAQNITRTSPNTFGQTIIRTPPRNFGILVTPTTPGGTGNTNTAPSGNRGGSTRPTNPGGFGIFIPQGPTYVPPRRTPTKKVYRKPKYVPKKKIVRRPPPRPLPHRPAIPVIAPIPQFIPNEIVILLQGQPSNAEDAVAQAHGLVKLSSTPIALLDGQLVRYRIPRGRTLPQTIIDLTADPRVTLAQPNNYYLTVQHASRPAPASAQYALAKLGLNGAHRLVQGRDVRVAVIDTGVDATHPVLGNSISSSYDAVADGRPATAGAHGTAIAGLISGRGQMQGVAPLASIMAVRAFYMHPQYNRPVTSSAILLRAMDWAYRNSARVFNMSFAGPFDPLVKTALTAANDKGVVLVAAAGNGGPKAAPAYPAAYENVIAITALDANDRLYAHANRGKYLTAAAPGVDVLVPALNKGYKYSSGTSMAAAHVSGLVALLLESDPAADTRTIVNAIVAGAHDLGPKGFDMQFGAGRADANASLLRLKNGQVRLTAGQ